ncbi:hypothetical protein [Parvimonas micra]|uniref:Iron transport-associated domain protein n=1 Tax=Parvimonas micra ATCC 33270 TaxID=411465 RepID=A8SLC0_9FIRM|nr:hypothetical protein [Parvimonas micra]EDP24352.1 hypothetical protein PEPMIC_00935 [Parvimonas micra ATCC 33270]RSB90589.1 hypothetical protein EGS00_02165 [Parvimonas micra]VEH97434.1 Uncharacterised protein [Parvimonas micra]
MNQKMLKKFLVGLLAFNIFTTGAFSAHENDSKITYAQEKQSFAFVISDQSGPIMTKDFTFEVLDEKGGKTEVKSMMSMLNLKLSKGKYTVRLKDDEYTMKDVSFTVTDDGIANYDSIVNFMLTKKKAEEKAKEIPITIMLTTQNGKNKDIVMGNYEFEVFDKESGKFVTSVTSDKSMLNLKLPDGIYTLKLKKNNDYTMKDVRLDVYEDDGSYTIDEKESMELNLVKITSEPEKPENEEAKGSKEVLVRVLFEGKPKSNFSLALMEFDPIPNIVQQKSTDEKGEVKFSGFKSNVKYQLRLRSTDKTMTFETEVFEFTTNEKGMITKINNKEVNSKEDAVVEFRGSNKDSEKFKTFPVEFYAKYKDGTPAKGVEFSINRLSPRLSSYRKAKSDENGKVVFMLEGEAPKDASFGRLYNITISKMEMFKHKSVPFGMDFTVDDKGNIKVISVEREIDDKETDTSNPDKYNKTFTLEKEDKTHIYNEFKAQYEKAVEYLKNTKFENSKESNKAKKDLENVIFASKAELEETIPEYALKKTDELKNAMDNLKKFEIADENPSKSEEKVNKIVNSKEKVTVESEGLNAKLKLIVKRLDKNTVETLKNKNADLFDIFFTLGNGTEKMPKQNYKVTLEKRKGETVKQVCYVNEDGKLKKLEFTQDDKNVTFTTTHFSKYAVIYENKSEVKREVKKDVKKAQKMPKTSISGISLAVPTLLFGVMIVINKKRNK